MGRAARWHQPRRASADAADGTFLPDPLPQIVMVPTRFAGNGCARHSFSVHANDTLMVPLLRAVRRRDCGRRASATRAGNPAASDRAAAFAEYSGLCAERLRLGGDRGPVGRGTWRQACQVQWRVVPALGRRSPDARAGAGKFRQNAGHPAARQSRRKPQCAAEIVRQSVQSAKA